MINLNKEDQDFHHQLHFPHKKKSAELSVQMIWKRKMIQILQVFSVWISKEISKQISTRQ